MHNCTYYYCYLLPNPSSHPHVHPHGDHDDEGDQHSPQYHVRLCSEVGWLHFYTLHSALLIVRMTINRSVISQALGDIYKLEGDNILVRAECVRCPWLLAETKVATIFITKL